MIYLSLPDIISSLKENRTWCFSNTQQSTFELIQHWNFNYFFFGNNFVECIFFFLYKFLHLELLFFLFLSLPFIELFLFQNFYLIWRLERTHSIQIACFRVMANFLTNLTFMDFIWFPKTFSYCVLWPTRTSLLWWMKYHVFIWNLIHNIW